MHLGDPAAIARYPPLLRKTQARPTNQVNGRGLSSFQLGLSRRMEVLTSENGQLKLISLIQKDPMKSRNASAVTRFLPSLLNKGIQAEYQNYPC